VLRKDDLILSIALVGIALLEIGVD